MSVKDRGFDKTKPFWLVVPIDRADGSFTPPSADGRASFEDANNAAAYVARDLNKFGGQYAIYRCEPIHVIGELD